MAYINVVVCNYRTIDFNSIGLIGNSVKTITQAIRTIVRLYIRNQIVYRAIDTNRIWESSCIDQGRLFNHALTKSS